jgi:hypothetical protein
MNVLLSAFFLFSLFASANKLVCSSNVETVIYLTLVENLNSQPDRRYNLVKGISDTKLSIKSEWSSSFKLLLEQNSINVEALQKIVNYKTGNTEATMLNIIKTEAPSIKNLDYIVSVLDKLGSVSKWEVTTDLKCNVMSTKMIEN